MSFFEGMNAVFADNIPKFDRLIGGGSNEKLVVVCYNHGLEIIFFVKKFAENTRMSVLECEDAIFCVKVPKFYGFLIIVAAG